jgi:hypothetical protein
MFVCVCVFRIFILVLRCRSRRFSMMEKIFPGVSAFLGTDGRSGVCGEVEI